MLSEKQKIKLRKLFPTKYGKIAEAAYKTWERHNPIFECYGINFKESHNQEIFVKDDNEKGFCVIGAAILKKKYIVNFAESIQKLFSLSVTECEYIEFGFDGFSEYTVKDVTPDHKEAYEFGRTVRSILMEKDAY